MALDKADLVLHEGVVSGYPASDSIAVANGLIIAHGAFADLKPMVGPRTHMIRLAGRTVTPGFIDCHIHFMEGAAVANGLNVMRCRTISDLLADLRLTAGKTPPGNWLRAFGCDEAMMRERRGPTRAELDGSIGRHPLRLRHQTLHASWLNSRAITSLGLEAAGFNPPHGAWLEREPSGRLTGFVVGMDEWISQRLPRVTPAELEARTRVYSRELAAAGITTFTDATVRNGPEDVATFALLSAKGAIGQRIGVMIGQNQVDAINISRQAAEAAGFRLSGVKFMDLARWEPAPLARRVGRALSTGLDVAFHVTEVEELEAAITAIKASRREVNPRTLESTVCRIEHGGLIPDDYLQRLAALGVWVVTNPGFIHYRGPKYTTDPGLVPYLYRARSLLDASVQIAGATDAPVTPAKPFNAIAAAMNRLSMDGEELAPAESISFNEAFDLFTRSAARLSRLGAGEIATGYLADLIVVAADPANLTAAEIQTLAVDLTIVNGRVIYERGRPAVAQSDIANLYSP